jgi:hypothetical protein
MKLRRRGHAALDSAHVEFKSEDYDDDQELCMAVANELLEMLEMDREYLSQMEGEDD